MRDTLAMLGQNPALKINRGNTTSKYCRMASTDKRTDNRLLKPLMAL